MSKKGITKYDNFIGKELGEVRVIKNIGNKYSWVAYYLCECLACGETKEVSGVQLQRGNRQTHQGCKAKKRLIVCKGCGKQFIKYISIHKTEYCSRVCHSKYFVSSAPHGTRTRYNTGCKCDECRVGNTLAHQKYILSRLEAIKNK